MSWIIRWIIRLFWDEAINTVKATALITAFMVGFTFLNQAGWSKMTISNPPEELRHNGQIAILRTARTGHKCSECGLPIRPREHYYCTYLAGAGLGNIKFPGAKHIHCLLGNRGK